MPKGMRGRILKDYVTAVSPLLTVWSRMVSGWVGADITNQICYKTFALAILARLVYSRELSWVIMPFLLTKHDQISMMQQFSWS